jgi:hypothetical protein
VPLCSPKSNKQRQNSLFEVDEFDGEKGTRLWPPRCDIIDAIADHRGLWPAMTFASEMLVAIAAKIEGEVGPAEVRSVLQLILERTRVCN